MRIVSKSTDARNEVITAALESIGFPPVELLDSAGWDAVPTVGIWVGERGVHFDSAFWAQAKRWCIVAGLVGFAVLAVGILSSTGVIGLDPRIGGFMELIAFGPIIAAALGPFAGVRFESDVVRVLLRDAQVTRSGMVESIIQISCGRVSSTNSSRNFRDLASRTGQIKEGDPAAALAEELVRDRALPA